MRRLFPGPPEEIDPEGELAAPERPPPADRPWVAINMIAAVDGEATVSGLSGGLGGEPDKRVFRAMRSLPDAILAASGTVVAEEYGPSRPSAEVRASRRARGQSEVPPIAVISGGLNLDWDGEFFADAESQPIIITTADADAERRAQAAEVADVIAAGEGRVDLGLALSELARKGVDLVLVEGGPSLNGQLLRDDLVDELNLTVAPLIAGGDGPGIVRGRALTPPRQMDLAGVMEEEGFLFLRYVRADR